MEKTATLNLRVNPTVKKRAEEVLAQLGISMSTAIDIYLNQISLTGGIPFAVTLPKAPASLNTDLMSTGEIREKLSSFGLHIEIAIKGLGANTADAIIKILVERIIIEIRKQGQAIIEDRAEAEFLRLFSFG